MIRLIITLLITTLTITAQTHDDIAKGAAENWLTYAGSYAGWRYSPLTQITPQNVNSLVPKWIYRVPGARGLQSSPIVYQGVLYVTAPNAVHALDARTGRLIWQYADPRAQKSGPNRGAAIWADKIYFTTSDNFLTALNRHTGAILFHKQFADVSQGTTSTSAPLIARGKVIVGSAGGDSGMRGFIMALSADTGETLWKTYTIPARGEKGSETWGDLIDFGGGAAWLSGTYDPQLNTLYWTTGNPWPDYNGDVRPGDNLYSCSLLALDLDTGRMKWHFQFTPHDTHDWDAQSWPSSTPTATASSTPSTASPASSSAPPNSSTKSPGPPASTPTANPSASPTPTPPPPATGSAPPSKAPPTGWASPTTPPQASSTPSPSNNAACTSALPNSPNP
jgi:alcohol dehydrogenase (cytochrome c)